MISNQKIVRNTKGQFSEGMVNTGRPPGSKNKVGKETKAKFQALIDCYSIEQMEADLLAIKPEERLRIISGMLEFFIPRLNRIDNRMSIENEKIIIELPAIFTE